MWPKLIGSERKSKPCLRGQWPREAMADHNVTRVCLTFELRGALRYGAWPARPMIDSTAWRAKCHAGARPLERRVRRRWWRAMHALVLPELNGPSKRLQPLELNHCSVVFLLPKRANTGGTGRRPVPHWPARSGAALAQGRGGQRDCYRP
jgi:hypothetical protein